MCADNTGSKVPRGGFAYGIGGLSGKAIRENGSNVATRVHGVST
jgi:hypothetical protein